MHIIILTSFEWRILLGFHRLFNFLILLQYRLDALKVTLLWFWDKVLDAWNDWPELQVKLSFVLGVLVLLQKCLYLWNKSESFQSNSQSLVTKELFFRVKLIVENIVLTVGLSLCIIIGESDFPFEERVFAFSVEFDQYESSIVVDSIMNYFYFWRETGFHLADDELFGFMMKVIVEMVHLWGIRGTIYFEGLDVFRLKRDLEVEGRGEVGKIEVLEDIFLYIILIDCAEIVESFHIFQFFTDFGPKFIRNSHNCQCRPGLWWSLFEKHSLVGDAIVVDVG
jgi:hypothetical protein